MILLLMLAFVAGLVATASFIWLTVVAFKAHVGWGLAVLFIPLAFLVFAIKFWEETKRPFLIHVASSVAGFLLVVTFGGALFGKAVSAMPQSPEEAEAFFENTVQEAEASGLLDAGAREELEKMKQAFHEAQARTRTGNRPDAAQTAMHTPPRGDGGIGPSGLVELQDSASSSSATVEPSEIEPPRAPRRATRGSDGTSIPVSRADDYTGKVLRVRGSDGLDAVAVLTKVGADRLVFERPLSGGTAFFEVRPRDVESLHLVYR